MKSFDKLFSEKWKPHGHLDQLERRKLSSNAQYKMEQETGGTYCLLETGRTEWEFKENYTYTLAKKGWYAEHFLRAQVIICPEPMGPIQCERLERLLVKNENFRILVYQGSKRGEEKVGLLASRHRLFGSPPGIDQVLNLFGEISSEKDLHLEQ